MSLTPTRPAQDATGDIGAGERRELFQRRSRARGSGAQLAMAIAIAAGIGLAGIAFRTAALSQFSTLPAGFEGPGLFRIHYLLDHQRLLVDPVPAYSYWSGGINTRLGSYLTEVYGAGLVSLSAWLSQPTRLLHQIVLTTALTVLALWLLMRRSRNRRLRDAALVAALATLGTPLVIYYMSGWNVAYGWVLLLALTAVCTSSLSVRSKIVLSFALTLIGPPVYHSFGFLLITYAVALWMLGRVVNLNKFIVSPLAVVVAYLAYQIYVSIQFFGELVATLRDVLTLAFLERDVGLLALTPATFMGVELRYVHLVLYGLLAVPVAIQVGRYAMTLRSQSRANGPVETDRLLFWTATTALAVSVGLFGLASGARFSSEQLVARGAAYVIVPSLVAIIAELRARAPRYAYVYPLGIVVLLLSGFAFWGQASSVYSGTQVTNEEAEGYQWLTERLTTDSVVWTDFRLSGPFIADGHLRVIGIHGQLNEPTDALLETVYYSSTPDSVGPAIDQVRTYDGKVANFLFLSMLMTRNFPGPTGYGTQFSPVPLRFFEIVEASPAWELIYQNAEVRVYGRVAVARGSAQRPELSLLARNLQERRQGARAVAFTGATRPISVGER